MEVWVCRETSVFFLSHIKVMLHSTSCYTHYSSLTLGTQIICCRHKSCEVVDISKKQMPKSETYLPRKASFTCQQATQNNTTTTPNAECSFTAQSFKTGICRIGSALKPWGQCCLSHSPSPHFPFNKLMLRKTENWMKPLSTFRYLGLLKTPPHSSVAFFVQKQANHGRQAVMYYVFTDTFSYLIGGTSGPEI